MSLSSVCVVTNALRLNLFKINGSKRDKRIKRDSDTQEQENVRIIKIKGMMCGHCEERVKKALEQLPEVKSVSADHKTGKATVVLNDTTDENKLKEAVEKEGYKVISIK